MHSESRIAQFSFNKIGVKHDLGSSRDQHIVCAGWQCAALNISLWPLSQGPAGMSIIGHPLCVPSAPPQTAQRLPASGLKMAALHLRQTERSRQACWSATAPACMLMNPSLARHHNMKASPISGYRGHCAASSLSSWLRCFGVQGQHASQRTASSLAAPNQRADRVTGPCYWLPWIDSQVCLSQLGP